MRRRWRDGAWGLLLSTAFVFLLACILLYRGVDVLTGSPCVTLNGRNGEAACVSNMVVGPGHLVASALGFLSSILLGRLSRIGRRVARAEAEGRNPR